MNLSGLSGMLCLMLSGLGVICPVLSQEPLIDNNLSQDRETESQLKVNPHLGLIVGVWRGFHEMEDETLYYGYQFRPNGTFSARHRLYQGEETLEDDSWQGEWTFDGEILRVEGKNPSNPEKPLKIEFRLAEDLQLYHQDGSLAEPYFPVRLGKVR